MAEVALTFEHDDDPDPASVLLIVDGSANSEPVRFVIDTGAKTSSVPNIGSISTLTAIGTDTGRGASATSSGDDIVMIDEIVVGDLTATSIQASRSDHTTRPLLGMDALGRHRCHFQFSRSRLELDGPIDSRHPTRELARQANGSPLVDVDFGALTVQACWDTGASLTVIDAQFARENPQLVDTHSESSGFDAVGTPMSGTAGILSACSIGGQRFDATSCIILDLGPLNATLESPLSIIIGMPLARQADWLFDFPENRWYVTHF